MKAQLDSVGNLLADYAIEVDTDFGHLAPDWVFVIDNGISGVLRELHFAADRKLTKEQAEFFDCTIKIWEAIRKFVLRLAVKKRSEGLNFCADNLEYIADNAPKTLAQAMQLSCIVYNLETNLECACVRSLGRLDKLYYKFYISDLKSGVTENEIRALTCHFLYKFHSMHATANIPIAICGINANGSDASNDYTKLLLEEYGKLNIEDPKFHVYCHAGMRTDIFNMILDMSRHGKNSFVFINCDVVEKALIGIGISQPDARDFITYGCYEAASAGREIPATCAGRINLPKAVEYTLAGGNYESFEAFYSALKKKIKLMLDSCMDSLTAWEPHYDELCPAPMLAATYLNCREIGKDIFCGGAKYNNTSVVASCIASLVDMVTGIEKTVYQDKIITLEGMKSALSANWSGYEALQRYCSDKCPKYGCGDPEADRLTADLCDFISERCFCPKYI